MIFLLLSCGLPAGGDARTWVEAHSALDTGEAGWSFLEPDRPGRWDAGVTTFEFTDARGKELVAEIWYPGAAPNAAILSEYPPTGLSGEAYRDIPPALWDAPLIGFSHGYSAIRFQSIFLTERLAQHGYVVVAVDHPGNTMFDLDEDADLEVLLARPGDVSASVDAALARSADPDDPLHGVIGGEEWLAVGHSFGAYTTLILAGAEVDYSGVEPACDADPDLKGCKFLSDYDMDEIPVEDHADPRVVGGVPMSPGLWYTFGVDGVGLGALQPTLFLAGDADDLLGYENEARPTWAASPAGSTLLTFRDAGHYGFSDICALASFLSEECQEEEGGWADISQVQEHARTAALAMAGWLLRGEEGYREWLEPAAWERVEMVTGEVR